VVKIGPDADRSLVGQTVASYSPHAMYVSAPQNEVVAVPWVFQETMPLYDDRNSHERR